MHVRTSLLIAALCLGLSGCGPSSPAPEKEPLQVYSFHGESDSLSVANGVLVLNGRETIFSGGTLSVCETPAPEVTAWSATFCLLSGGERHIVLSHSVTDLTGTSTSLLEEDLGRISGGSVLSQEARQDLREGDAELLFELETTRQDGAPRRFTLPLTLTEITSTAD